MNCASERNCNFYGRTLREGATTSAKTRAMSSTYFLGGGGGRTRTYEGIASGFTVRPLCRSGHSPKAVAPY